MSTGTPRYAPAPPPLALLFAFTVSLFCFLWAFTRIARAAVLAQIPDPTGSIQSLAFQTYTAVMSGQRAIAAGSALLVAVYALRRFVTPLLPKIAALRSIPDVAAMAFTLLVSVLGAVGTALAAGQPITSALVTTALTLGFGAAGGFAIFKKAFAELTVLAHLPWLYSLVFPTDTANS